MTITGNQKPHFVLDWGLFLGTCGDNYVIFFNFFISTSANIKSCRLITSRRPSIKSINHFYYFEVLRRLRESNTTILPQSPYSPDLVPPDFLFPKLKKRRFDIINDIKQKCLKELQKIFTRNNKNGITKIL